MAKTLHPELPITNINNRCYKVYGKQFAFTDAKSREASRREAESYALTRIAVMQKQAGRPLTSKEVIEGRLTPPAAEPTGPRSLKRERDPDRNPWDQMVQEMEQKPGHTESDRKQRERRLEDYKRRQAEWNVKRAAEVAAEANAADPDSIRFRAHATDKLEAAQLDGNLTPAQVEQRRQLKMLADKPSVTPGEYWSAVRDAFPSEGPPVKPDVTGPRNLFEAAADAQ